MRRAALASLVVLAAAAWLRFHDLSSWSLDGDELYSHYDAAAILAGEPWPQGARSHPLGYLAMAAGVALLGPGEGALRLVPALCGLGAVAALLWMRRDAVPRGAALAAGTLAAISPWLVYHAQEARFYAPLLLFATLATLWALPGPRRRLALAAAAFVGAVLCHPSALLLGPPLLAAAALGDGGRRRLLLAGLGAAAVGGALALLAGRAQWEVVSAAFERENLAHYGPVRFLLGLGYNLGLGVGLLLLAVLPALLRGGPGRGAVEGRLLLAFAAFPPALLLLVALAGVSTQQRYAMAAVPAALLLAGRGWSSLAGRPALLAGASAAALLVPAPALVAYAADGDRSDYRAAAAWIAGHAAPQDILVADEHNLLRFYLDGHEGFEATILEEAPLPANQRRDFLVNRREIWVLLKANRMGGDYGEVFTAWVREHCEPAATLGVPPPALARHDNRLLVFRRAER